MTIDLTTRENAKCSPSLARADPTREIGEILYVSKKTVSVHVANIKAKLGASSRVEIAIYAIELGLVEGTADGRPQRLHSIDGSMSRT